PGLPAPRAADGVSLRPQLQRVFHPRRPQVRPRPRRLSRRLPHLPLQPFQPRRLRSAVTPAAGQWRIKPPHCKPWNLMNLANARSFFPGTQGRVFLDAACISLAPVQAVEALNAFGQRILLCPERDASSHHVTLDRTAHATRREIAALIGAQASDIALVESTTHALEIVAASVPLQRGDVVLVGETEFLGLAVPWIPRQERNGFHIQTVPHRDGRLLVDDFA